MEDGTQDKLPPRMHIICIDNTSNFTQIAMKTW